MNKILIIDDDQGIVDALMMAFRMFGYDVKGVQHSTEAEAMMGDFKPDLVILDMLLSGENGTDVCRRMKADTNTKNLPIVMMSAHPSAERQMTECGADAFLPKPFSVNMLLDLAKKYIPGEPGSVAA